MIWPRVGNLVPGPIEPATKRGEVGVAYSSATRRAILAEARANSCARSAMPYSLRTTENAPKESVSMASTPTSRNERCSDSTASGLETTRNSLHPSSTAPPKSSASRCWSCRFVPVAPSKITTRCSSARR